MWLDESKASEGLCAQDVQNRAVHTDVCILRLRAVLAVLFFGRMLRAGATGLGASYHARDGQKWKCPSRASTHVHPCVRLCRRVPPCVLCTSMYFRLHTLLVVPIVALFSCLFVRVLRRFLSAVPPCCRSSPSTFLMPERPEEQFHVAVKRSSLAQMRRTPQENVFREISVMVRERERDRERETER